MTSNPTYCLPEDTAQSVARSMGKANVGSVPVISDRQSRRLTGIITDHDLCCSIVAQGLDPATTAIREHMHKNPVVCRADERVDSAEHVMQKHQVRRIPVVDRQGSVVGIVSQADIALKHEPQQISRTVTEISRARAVAA